MELKYEEDDYITVNLTDADWANIKKGRFSMRKMLIKDKIFTISVGRQ